MIAYAPEGILRQGEREARGEKGRASVTGRERGRGKKERASLIARRFHIANLEDKPDIILSPSDMENKAGCLVL